MEPLIKPPKLKPGATIGVAAVSGPVDEGRLERGLAHLRGRGYRVVEAANLRTRRGFLAGSDRERAAGYRQLLDDPNVDAIFFARGGYGSSRVLGLLDGARADRRPKIHLGSSDLTALFAHLRKHVGLVTFYGPMVAVDFDDTLPLDWESVLAGALPVAHRFHETDILSPGRAEGVLVGGCLSLLASLAGTPEAINARDAVLFWEDIGEEAYRLDRLLTQLERSGTLNDLRGMVIGSVASGGRGDSPEAVQEYLRDRFRDAAFPVAMGFPAGHLPRPRTLPLGTRVQLDLENGSQLTFLEIGTI